MPEGTRAFGLLLTARTVSLFGDSLGLVALMLHVAAETGTAAAVALLLLVGDVAPALVGPVAGAMADRFDRRRIMIAADLVQAAAVASLAVGMPSLPVLLVVVAVQSGAGHVFAPASRSAVVSLVPPEGLGRANAHLGLSTNIADGAGPFAAAALLPLIGIAGVLAVDAVTFLVSAALLAGVRTPRAAPAATEPLGASTRDGLRLCWNHRGVRTVLLGYAGVVACTGVDDVALVFLGRDLGRDVLGGTDSATAVLLGAVGAGIVAGYAVLGRIAGWAAARIGLPVLMLLGFAVAAGGNLATGLVPVLLAAVAVQAVRGLGIAAMDVAASTLLPRLVPDDAVGRVFGILYAGLGIAAALSYTAGAFLLDAVGPQATLVLAGGAGLAVTAATAVALRREAGAAPSPPPSAT